LIKHFEVLAMSFVKRDRDVHHLTQGQLGLALAVFVTIAHQLLVPQGFKNLAEIIHSVESSSRLSMVMTCKAIR
jgi:hypothetical protein